MVDGDNKLIGRVQLDDLLLGTLSDSILKITKPIEHFVHPEEDQEQIALLFSRHDLNFLPVIDESKTILGQITPSNIQDVMQEEANEDLLSFVGADPEESIDDRGQSKIKSALGRFPWLLFSISVSMLTGYILSFFERETEKAIIFASFVPLIMNTTGNIGTQSAMIIVRNFALEANQFNLFRLPLMREFTVGLFLSFMATIITFLLVSLLYNDPAVSIQVSITLFSSMILASLFGIFIPIGFKKMGVDPAIASGPLVTSACDLLGVGLYLLVIILLKDFY